MTSIGMLCHFCESHGPRIVFCCQPYLENQVSSNSHENMDQVFDPISPDETFRSRTCFYGQLDQYLIAVADQNPNSSNRMDTCRACASAESLKPIFLTNDHTLKISFVASQYPYNPDMLAIANQACVRSLSCEVSGDETGEGVIFFGDEANGYCMSYTFALRDSKARGFRRWYSLCILSAEKLLILNSYESIAQRLTSIVTQLQVRANQVSELEAKLSGGDDAARMAAGGHERLGWMPSGFVKERLGDEQAPARSVADLVDDQTIYEKLHKFLVSVLKIPTGNFVSQLLDGSPSQDELFRAEQITLIEEHHEDPFESDDDQAESGASQDNNSTPSTSYSNSTPVEHVDRSFLPQYGDEDLPYAQYVNGGLNCRRDSAVDQPPDRDAMTPLRNLSTLYQIFGVEAFRILAGHVLIGDQLVVRADRARIARSVLNAMASVLPVGCQRMVPYSDAYLPPWQCNLLGLNDRLANAPPPSLSGDGSGASCGQTGTSYVVVTAKTRSENLTSKGPVPLELCNFRLHHVGVPPVAYPSIVERLLGLLSEFGQNRSLPQCDTKRLQIMELRLTVLKEEWINKAKLYFRMSKRQNGDAAEMSRRQNCILKISKIDQPIDLTVVKFFQAGLTKEYKSHVLSRVAERIQHNPQITVGIT